MNVPAASADRPQERPADATQPEVVDLDAPVQCPVAELQRLADPDHEVIDADAFGRDDVPVELAVDGCQAEDPDGQLR